MGFEPNQKGDAAAAEAQLTKATTFANCATAALQLNFNRENSLLKPLHLLTLFASAQLTYSYYIFSYDLN
jgi:hypothetical protein